MIADFRQPSLRRRGVAYREDPRTPGHCQIVTDDDPACSIAGLIEPPRRWRAPTGTPIAPDGTMRGAKLHRISAVSRVAPPAMSVDERRTIPHGAVISSPEIGCGHIATPDPPAMARER
jgi:hypothetical protein